MSEGWVTVATAQGAMQADLIKNRLLAEGIPVFEKYEAIGRVLPLTMDGLGEVEIQVPPEYAEAARVALAAAEAEASADDDPGVA